MEANYERYRSIIEGEKKNIPQIELLRDTQERIKISAEEQKLAPTQKDLDRSGQKLSKCVTSEQMFPL